MRAVTGKFWFERVAEQWTTINEILLITSYILQLCTRMVELMAVRMVMIICTSLFNVSFFMISYILLLPSYIS